MHQIFWQDLWSREKIYPYLFGRGNIQCIVLAMACRYGSEKKIEIGRTKTRGLGKEVQVKKEQAIFPLKCYAHMP
jgi:hypothetical protein